jgi:hypothetical protein
MNEVKLLTYRQYASGWTTRLLFPAEVGILLLATACKLALGSTQLPIQCVPVALFLEVKRPGREADHSLTFIQWRG